jgi:hypothetical protein
MERIAELSGVDPLKLDGMLALSLGVQLLPWESCASVDHRVRAQRVL